MCIFNFHIYTIRHIDIRRFFIDFSSKEKSIMRHTVYLHNDMFSLVETGTIKHELKMVLINLISLICIREGKNNPLVLLARLFVCLLKFEV